MLLVLGALFGAGSISGSSGLLWIAGSIGLVATMWLFMKAFDH